MLNFQWKEKLFFPLTTCLLLLTSCSVQKKIARSANSDVLDVAALQTAHIGISIYEPGTNKFWYDHQGDKYFVPASNTKIPTCYAVMKYLGDSLEGLRYVAFDNNKNEKTFWIQPTGDPTLLHPDFKSQPVIDFLKKDTSADYLVTSANQWEDTPWGAGWTWGDFAAYYMAERSQFPVYGNAIHIKGSDKGVSIVPGRFEFVYDGKESSIVFDRKINKYSFGREKDSNRFLWKQDSAGVKNQEIPFITSLPLTASLLKDTVAGLKLSLFDNTSLMSPRKIYSQSTDSMLRLLMHRSDNFFAEQSLQMVSFKKLGVMNDRKIIDTILKTDLKDLPHPPRWADGSGLSRYNLFTPQDFIFILKKMKDEFGMERIKVILPTGGEGTISSYYKADSGYIYVKTGTLSGVVALSGFLYTKKGKELIFSILVNNHQASATDVRRAVEKFLQRVRNKN
jgi:D-alanyl-D-alanine carboxypeptidase/D-alanyl-D-alanine-endopeptidase (penicillin-binding protein 4)